MELGMGQPHPLGNIELSSPNKYIPQYIPQNHPNQAYGDSDDENGLDEDEKFADEFTFLSTYEEEKEDYSGELDI